MIVSGNTCETPGRFRKPNSCTEYYSCIQTEHFGIVALGTMKCNFCLKFNAQLGKCVLSKEVPECEDNDDTKRNCTGPGTFPVPNDQKKYYVCRERQGFIELQVKSCPDDLIFDPNTSECWKQTSNEPKCNKTGWIADKYNCRKYFYCTNPKGSSYNRYEFRCNIGYYFNIAHNYCEFEEDSLICLSNKLEAVLDKRNK